MYVCMYVCIYVCVYNLAFTDYVYQNIVNDAPYRKKQE